MLGLLFLFKILAAILHLGNLHLLVDEDDDSICVIDQDDECESVSAGWNVSSRFHNKWAQAFPKLLTMINTASTRR